MIEMATLAPTATPKVPARRLTWSSPTPSLWIASFDSEFVAMVDELSESSFVLKLGGRRFGPFSNLQSAQAALDARLPGGSSARKDWNLFVSASIVGVICVLAAGALVIVGLH
jgi:hypothetical protein